MANKVSFLSITLAGLIAGCAAVTAIPDPGLDRALASEQNNRVGEVVKDTTLERDDFTFSLPAVIECSHEDAEGTTNKYGVRVQIDNKTRRQVITYDSDGNGVKDVISESQFGTAAFGDHLSFIRRSDKRLAFVETLVFAGTALSCNVRVASQDECPHGSCTMVLRRYDNDWPRETITAENFEKDHYKLVELRSYEITGRMKSYSSQFMDGGNIVAWTQDSVQRDELGRIILNTRVSVNESGTTVSRNKITYDRNGFVNRFMIDNTGDSRQEYEERYFCAADGKKIRETRRVLRGGEYAERDAPVTEDEKCSTSEDAEILYALGRNVWARGL